MGYFGDVSIKVGDFFIPGNFLVLDIVKNAYTQIILGRPFSANTGCKIDVRRRGELTFDVGEHYAKFGAFKDQDSSLASFAYCGCDVPISDVIIKFSDLRFNDPHMVDYESIKGHGLDCATTDLVAHLPPSVDREEPYAVNGDSLSDYCRFIRVLMSLPPLGRVEYDFDLGV